MARRKPFHRRPLRLQRTPRSFIAIAATALLASATGIFWLQSRENAEAPHFPAPPPNIAKAEFPPRESAEPKSNITRAPRPSILTPGRVKAIGAAGRTIDGVIREMETFTPKKKGGAKPMARVGFLANSLEDDAVVTSHHPEQLLSGASNIKLYTTAAALVRLGPDFRFETKFASDATIQNGVLEGDLWIIGGGDPTLTSEDRLCEGGATAAITRAVAELANRGVRRVRGAVVLDDRYFSDAKYHPGWPSHDRGKPHAIDVSALCAEHHKIEVTARASGGGAEIDLRPQMSGLRIENNVNIVAKGAAKGIVARVDGDTLRVSGSVASGDADSTSLYMLDGPKLFGHVALRAFENCSISVDHGARPAGLLEAAPRNVMVKLQSASTLADVVNVTNRESDNLYAEMLLKILGAKFGGAGTSAAGVEVVRGVLRELGVPVEGYAAVDGCGLARDSRISPATTVALLAAMSRTRFYDIYKNSLPGAGESPGTLRKRMKESLFSGRVRAKTGSLDGVTSLSGYVDAANGETFVFSCLTNYTEFAGSFKPDEDRCVRALVEVGAK